VATRRIQIVKYRGGRHGTNEYPFLIAEDGIDILPITSIGLEYVASTERVSTGIPGLDGMLGGRGFFRGSSILVSGTAGTGKSSIAACFADAACRRGERCLYFAFEESQNQILRNMRSIGLDLEQWVRGGLLEFQVARPTMHGLETHIATIQKSTRDFEPGVVIMDPITDFLGIGTALRVKQMLTRVVDFFKGRGITALFTSLFDGPVDQGDSGISSSIDSWILVRNLERNGDRQRGLYVLKSRGMSHSSRVGRLRMTDRGVDVATDDPEQ
jgi:circadian clock protein KaiC